MKTMACAQPPRSFVPHIMPSPQLRQAVASPAGPSQVIAPGLIEQTRFYLSNFRQRYPNNSSRRPNAAASQAMDSRSVGCGRPLPVERHCCCRLTLKWELAVNVNVVCLQ